MASKKNEPILLSILIADANGMPEIGHCLTALEKQQDAGHVEVIVVEPGGVEMTQAIEKQFPWVRLLPLEDRLSIPEMRDLALEWSRGEIIAILEDHEVVPGNWCRNVLAAHRADPNIAAVAGPIQNCSDSSLIDWAAFFCEYCVFMPPIFSGITNTIPGNNVAYKRWVFEFSQSEDRKVAFWETNLHPVLLEHGHQFLMMPEIVVTHQKHFGFFEYLQQRYQYSRYYADFVSRKSSLPYKLLRAAACLILPPLLLKRILSCGLSKRRYSKELLISLHLLVIFTVVWALGEMAGYVMGAGQSLKMIE